nr:MAG TPA: endonuclease III [Caudoviricetes sp.]
MIQNLELLRMHFGDITKTCMANGIIDSTIKAIEKLAAYEDAEEQGRYIKLPEKVEETEYRECVHTRTKCHHENCKCSECPLTELFCDEFYTAIDRCYEDAYARGCLAGMEVEKAEAKLKEMEKGNGVHNK